MKNKETHVIDFYLTKLGKVMRFVEIISGILIVLGLLLSVFQSFVNPEDLKNKYQSIIEFGNNAIIYGLIFLLASRTIRNDYYINQYKMNH